ncbi:MAG: peptide chain release factor N(5)-glutamine methyltransferase [Candidatus Peribacteraceae bacterium]|jgi:release factor glutamine methyltransferase|nr:protein-(glutamine-N5) methyltransferase, release factor-specific [bacterium]MDP6562012.1 peptide chain release factor N(5)-glutamine methyltransferase [Candidatus Peribacteraceae bacterium]|tara:strand:- start:19432 stop:20202 length:771 start_codon:yes stop_codon:yes gene_type:complete
MTVEEALKSSGIDRLDAEILLADLLDKSREWLVAHPEGEIDTSGWEERIERRKNHEPVSYITNKQDFYGRDFYVDNKVLIPRPSTERLIDLFMDFLEDGEDRIRELDSEIIGTAMKLGDLAEAKTIVDVCTGSGCIAVTLALETDKRIIATDISKDALDVAKQNAEKYGVTGRIDFRHGDLLEPIKDLKEPFIIISNPPYIPEGNTLMSDVANFEPHLALFSGPDGRDAVVKINNNSKAHKWCRGLVIECEKGQLD